MTMIGWSFTTPIHSKGGRWATGAALVMSAVHRSALRSHELRSGHGGNAITTAAKTRKAVSVQGVVPPTGGTRWATLGDQLTNW